MQKIKVLITKKGLEELKTELFQRESVKKKELVDMLITSKDSGDERENDGFILTFEDFQINEQRLLDLKDIIDYHEVIDPKQNKKVELGHTVILKDSKGNTKEFHVVGDYEVDIFKGRISTKSPIGKELLGKKIGDQINIGNTQYTVKAIKKY